MHPRPLILPMLLVLAACAPMPALPPQPKAISAVPPQLMPLDQLLAQANATPAAQPRAQNLSARAAALQARAAAMRGPVTDPATRARLLAASGNGA